ncbi:MAG TPA: sigma-54 dependent transcriptional regulator [Thermoanaerobaculia bacterium]|nr:sigma-54 dependent transcriptional regulator [Thermoanaerobaculia bacterium]
MSDSPETPAGRATVLLIDDEDYVRESLAELLVRRGYEVREAVSGDEALEHRRAEGVDAVVCDLRMPGTTGKELVAALAEAAPGTPVLMLTAHGTVRSAVECLRAGAADYLLKPVDADELELAIERSLDGAARSRELRYLRAGRVREGQRLVGGSPGWLRLLETVEQVAPSDSPVLFIGESGTGKEEVARYLQARSRRRDHAFVAVNCAAIPGELFESELFGHRRGAFTGAVADREGRFRVAHRGTLFLDEINSLSTTAQAKLLRVLQDGAFERVGDSHPTRVDVRIVCAANVELEKEVEAGRFRADLFYRINVITLRLPPLRDRPGDVRLLASAFVDELSAKLGRRTPAIGGDAMAALEAYGWPGNVRELRNVIERAILLAPGESIEAASLPFVVASPADGAEPAVSDDLDLKRRLKRAERDTLVAALERARGVRRQAAGLLGIDERNLAYYLRKHDLMGWRPEGASDSANTGEAGASSGREPAP